ncbi:MAG: glutamate 5-kinase [bacterium]|nr:glutamate 5-kinase [bacterium]
MNFIPEYLGKRIVIKVGTSILASSAGELDISYIKSLVQDIVSLYKLGKEIIIVSSGAIGAGMKKLEMKNRPKTIPLKQACASIGQSYLMHVYENHFQKNGQLVAQVLLTHRELSERKSYINAYNTLSTLIDFKVIPIINENDAIATEELKFGDNDILAALVANLVGADTLIILTDVDGLWNEKEAKIIKVVEEINSTIFNMAQKTSKEITTGGMNTKLTAADIATKCGITTIIANGKIPQILNKIINKQEIGTLFKAKKKPLVGRKRWIAYTLIPAGSIKVDSGAKYVITEKGKSLLPSGITEVHDDFEQGDCIRIIDQEGVEFARGLVNYSSLELKKIKRKKTTQIEEILGYKYYDEVVHRDNLVIVTP